MTELPDYAALPPAPNGGRSAWGLFGAGDNLGLVNLMTPERIAAAARLVRRGQVFCLDMPFGSISPPMAPFRTPPRHRVLHQPGTAGFDDVYDNFYPQASSQWDSLAHVGYAPDQMRSEERRVGKECRCRWAPRLEEKREAVADDRR